MSLELYRVTADDFRPKKKRGAAAPEPLTPALAALASEIDKLGQLSASAQKLLTPITSMERFMPSKDRIYISQDPATGVVRGLLRIGNKDLFFADESDRLRKFEQVVCILDFYVLDTLQRSGFGRALFDFALEQEGLAAPTMVAVDRPSPKMLGFLAKHYDLRRYRQQSNKFVVFPPFFKHYPATSSRR